MAASKKNPVKLVKDVDELTEEEQALKDLENEVQEDFTLDNWIQRKRKPKGERLVVFADEEANDAYAKHAEAISTAADQAERATDPERKAEFIQIHQDLEEQLLPLRDVMFESAVALYFNNPVTPLVDGARQKARKAYAANGIIPEDRAEEFAKRLNVEVAGACLTRVTTADGHDLPAGSPGANALYRNLPYSEWMRVETLTQAMVFRLKIVDAIEGDPDF